MKVEGAVKVLGVRADGGSKLYACFMSLYFGQQLISCTYCLGSSHWLSRQEGLPHSPVGAGGARIGVDVDTRQEAR